MRLRADRCILGPARGRSCGLLVGPCPAIQSPFRPAEPKPAAATPQFVNAAPEAGLTACFTAAARDKDHLLESTGTGAALIDYDGDGRLDAFLVNAWALDEEPSRVRVKGRNAFIAIGGRTVRRRDRPRRHRGRWLGRRRLRG